MLVIYDISVHHNARLVKKIQICIDYIDDCVALYRFVQMLVIYGISVCIYGNYE